MCTSSITGPRSPMLMAQAQEASLDLTNTATEPTPIPIPSLPTLPISMFHLLPTHSIPCTGLSCFGCAICLHCYKMLYSLFLAGCPGGMCSLLVLALNRIGCKDQKFSLLCQTVTLDLTRHARHVTKLDMTEDLPN